MKKEIGFKEFVALMAMMIALTALSIDAMLPALTNIGNDLGVTEPNDNQLKQFVTNLNYNIQKIDSFEEITHTINDLLNM